MLIRIEQRYVGVATPRPLEAGEHDLPDRVAAYFLRTFSGEPFFAKLVNPPAVEPEAPAVEETDPEEAPQDETEDPAESEEQTETVAQTMEPEETQIVKPTAPATRPRGRGRQPSRRK